MDTIAIIKQKLLDKQNEILSRLDRIDVHRKHKNGQLSADWQEQAIERENDEVLDALDETGRAELLQIRTALGQIEAGEYGNCSHCGETIREARLKALPLATTCIKCAS